HSQMPRSVSNAKIALLNAKLEIEKTEMDAKININRPEEMELFLQEEENLLNAMAQQVADSGANVLFTEKAADDEVLSILAKKGILTVKNVSSGDMEKLAKATGGSPVGTLKDFATKAGGREQLAIRAFADALEAIPVAIAQNAGIDPIDIMVDLRAKHNTPANKWFGVNVYTGKTADMWKLNIVEPLRVKKQ